jgi:predicted 2-oxoglutarate/Fe(II)-dependent dioxygenase YbiX
MGLRNGQPSQSLVARTSNPIAEYRSQLNTADWIEGRSMLTNANPEAQTKLVPSLSSAQRGLLPNTLIVGVTPIDARLGLYYTANRASLMISLQGG